MFSELRVTNPVNIQEKLLERGLVLSFEITFGTVKLGFDPTFSLRMFHHVVFQGIPTSALGAFERLVGNISGFPSVVTLSLNKTLFCYYSHI